MMSLPFRFAVPALLALALVLPSSAEETPAAPPPPAELTALRESALAALNASDFDKLLPLLTPGVVITFQNAEVARGRDGVKTLLVQSTSGPAARVQSFRINAKADDSAKLYGDDTAVITGSAAETFHLINGSNLELAGRWTATAVREEGQWRLAALHTSSDLFSNPLIEGTKKTGVTASVASLLIGLFAGWMLGRRKPDSVQL
jgi:uncharacterized protein (TIGR02246 family)